MEKKILFLKNILNNIADPVFVKDTKHRWIEGNTAFWILMGGPEEKFLGKNDYDFFPKEEADVFWEKDNKVFETGEMDVNEESFTDQKGVQHILSTKKVRFFDEKNEPVLVGIIHDITAERKLKELEEKSEQFYAVMRYAAVGMGLAAPDGKWLKVNNSLCGLAGYSEEELLQRSFQDILHPDDIAENARSIQKLLRKEIETFHAENRYIHKSGRIIWIMLDISVVWDIDNTAKYLIMEIRDITARKEAEQKILHQQEELRLIFDNVPISIWYKDDKNNIIRLNKTAAKSMGVSIEKAETTPTSELFPETADKYYREDQEIIRSGQPKFGIIEEYKPMKGEHGWVSADKVPFDDPATGKKSILVIARDITKQLEADKIKERLIAELTASNMELGRFAYICSHDLQEPLRMISNYTQLLVKHMGEGLDAKSKHYMEYIVGGVFNARQLIDDILSYSKIGSEAQKSTMVDCNSIIPLVQQNLGIEDGENRVIITYEKLPIVSGHRTYIAQLFQNLLGNAIKFHHKDRKPEIDIKAERKGNFWQFSVRDNGIGIDKAYHEKVFVIFQRLNRRTEYTGTGIGLAICKKIVENYGGKIWFESELGIGTTFFFTLPTGTNMAQES